MNARKIWERLICRQNSNISNLLRYLTVCPSKLSCTFQCGQNDKEHSDLAEIPLGQHF